MMSIFQQILQALSAVSRGISLQSEQLAKQTELLTELRDLSLEQLNILNGINDSLELLVADESSTEIAGFDVSTSQPVNQ